MELAADSTEVPYKKRLIGSGYILTEQEYAEFSAEMKAVSVQNANLKKEMAANDKKHKQEVERLSTEYSKR